MSAGLSDVQFYRAWYILHHLIIAADRVPIVDDKLQALVDAIIVASPDFALQPKTLMLFDGKVACKTWYVQLHN